MTIIAFCVKRATVRMCVSAAVAIMARLSGAGGVGFAQLKRELLDNAAHPVQEFRKVFRPYACDLHAMNATYFAQCLKGQRMIIVGDSTMRQVFQSLACLLHEEIVEGYLVVRHTHAKSDI